MLLALLAGAAYGVDVTLLRVDPVPVEVVRPERGRVEAIVTNTKAGTVRAHRRAQLSPEIGGRVVRLPVRAGDRVRRGQVLLELDSTSQRARLQKAERDVATAQARAREACLAADQAAREYDRYAALAERQIVADNLLEQLQSRAATARASCEAATAAVASARAAIDVIRSELAKCLLRAPFDAVVAEVSIELGEYTTPSPPGLPIPPVMELIDTSSIYVSAPMDEVDSARIHPGQPARVTIDSHPGRIFAGTVARVAPYVLDIESQNRTVEIDVELRDREVAATLLPGTSADVEVVLEVRENTLRIPTSTLLEGEAVFVVQEGRLLRRPLRVGLRNWEFTEVLAGLSESDRVVTTLDRAEIQEGVQVRVLEASVR